MRERDVVMSQRSAVDVGGGEVEVDEGSSRVTGKPVSFWVVSWSAVSSGRSVGFGNPIDMTADGKGVLIEGTAGPPLAGQPEPGLVESDDAQHPPSRFHTNQALTT